MTEPVAYLNAYMDNSTNITRHNPVDKSSILPSNNIVSSIPLYIAEQLYPRVKMTQKQYDRLMWDKENADLFQCIDYFNEHDGNSKFGVLTENLRGDLTQEDIARAWLNPEETIEIVPEMKWFVRRILPNAGGNMLYCTDEGELTYNYNKEYATQFDTKEKADLWTNPLTEAVQLPVEGE